MPLISARKSCDCSQLARRGQSGLKAGVKEIERKCNEKLGTLIGSQLSKELLRRKNCSLLTASITVGSDAWFKGLPENLS